MDIMVTPNHDHIRSYPSKDRTIASFSESECWNFFETRKRDLHRLLINLQFPDHCVLENRACMTGEEILLRGLYELVSGTDQFEIAVNVFGRDQILLRGLYV
jgi:hypothetical protein